MKALIYQYWSGDKPVYAQVSEEMFRDYAKHVGAEYRFDANPDFVTGKYSQYYSALRPVWDEEFHKYGRVLFLDMDVFPKAGLNENIFDLECGHLAMAREHIPDEPRRLNTGAANTENDLTWAKWMKRIWHVDIPFDAPGRPSIFNSGVVLYSGEGLRYANKHFIKKWAYILSIRLTGQRRFYRLDQNYLYANAFHKGTDFREISAGWNTQLTDINLTNGEIFRLDNRDENTKFIHLQTNDRRDMTREDLEKIVS